MGRPAPVSSLPLVKYRSTRSVGANYTFEDVLLTGLASDGGLFVPESMPRLSDGWREWEHRSALISVLSTFGVDEPGPVVDEAMGSFPDPPAPLVAVGDRLIYELFWGPTLSFKDQALQIVGPLLDRQLGKKGRRGLVLGATSGDTGSAAIHACRGRDNLDVVILFPEDRITDFQRRQMTTVPDANVTVVAVQGDFDDCQRLVKEAFGHDVSDHLVAINSINWARIACQIGYYVALGARIEGPFDVVIPTGNFGNAYAAFLAQGMGVDINRITIANNQNHMLSDLINRTAAAKMAVVPTIAPSMDIAVPSNLERFDDDLGSMFSAGWIDNDEILATISRVHSDHGYLLDPHTATGWSVGERTRTTNPQVVVATAHPAKFPEAIEAATGLRPEVPEGWEIDPYLPERVVTIGPEIEELKGLLGAR